MSSQSKTNYGPARITSLIIYGSLGVAILLATLLIIYDITNGTLIRMRFWVACAVIVYLLLTRFILKAGHVMTANWLLILIYEVMAFAILLHWGLTSVIGIVTACFVVLLPGVLAIPRIIAVVSLITFGVLIMTYTLHATGIVTPVPYTNHSSTGALDLIAFCTILSVFALVSWVSARQTSLSLDRAIKAEESVRMQKDLLATQLEKESIALRDTQLQQIQQLYRFAVIGQTATATLHELSNHLSILNLDIDDIKQQHRHSKAIKNAEDGIESINSMVRKAREQLNADSTMSPFNAIAAIKRVSKDMEPKFKQHGIKFDTSLPKYMRSYWLEGGEINLMQCISIILNNALDACKEVHNPYVSIALKSNETGLDIVIADNGPGIDTLKLQLLFKPLKSTKPSGLGVGLYIAKHLIESQFKGKLEYVPSSPGATFKIKLNAP